MQDLLELRSRIGRLFEEVMAKGGATELSGAGEWVPKVDLYELPDRIVLRADIPGVEPDSLDLRVEGGYLLLRGERLQPQDLDPQGLCRLERPFGSFQRRYALPDGVDAEGVTAQMDRGVLEITLRKRQTDVSRRIPVRVE